MNCSRLSCNDVFNQHVRDERRLEKKRKKLSTSCFSAFFFFLHLLFLHLLFPNCLRPCLSSYFLPVSLKMPTPKHESSKSKDNGQQIKAEPLKHDLKAGCESSAIDDIQAATNSNKICSASSNSKHQQRSSSKENKLGSDNGQGSESGRSKTPDLARTRSPSAKKPGHVGMPLSGSSIGSNGNGNGNESKRKEIVDFCDDFSNQPNLESNECAAQTSKGRKSSRKGSKKKDKSSRGQGGGQGATPSVDENGHRDDLSPGGKGGLGSSDIWPEESTTASNQLNNSTTGAGAADGPKSGAHGDRNPNKSCCFCWCCCCSCSW